MRNFLGIAFGVFVFGAAINAVAAPVAPEWAPYANGPHSRMGLPLDFLANGGGAHYEHAA